MAGLEIRKLDAWDIVFLCCYVLLILLIITTSVQKQKFVYELVLAFLSFYMIATTPFGLRFRGIYFSTCWLSFSIVLGFLRATGIAFFPLLVFVFIKFLDTDFGRSIIGNLYRKH